MTYDSLHVKSNQRFLFSLFELQKKNLKRRYKLIDDATDAQLKATLHCIRLIWSGQIPIRGGQIGDAIKKSKKRGHIAKHFNNDNLYKALKAKTVEGQKQVLKEIPFWRELLYNLFKKPRRRTH
jgi:hypothetical protein